MAVDIKSELTRPLALILAALAMLGWVLFVLSSWSAASVQKTQRLQIVQLTEKTDKLSRDLNQQRETTAALGDVQAKLSAARDDLTRVGQTRNDIQADLITAQRTLAATRRDLTEADRNLQSSNQKLSDIKSTTEETADVQPTVAPKAGRTRRTFRGRRASRSFNVRSR
jgi:biopolymer transport protein ExbB/TolQ